jgi:precorrin-2 dehydrogenase/sirohydrochlorin ferrochelatase
MKYYPVFLDLRERSCVVVGGGRVAERKALSLLEAGANVTVVSPSLTHKLQELSSSGKITHLAKTFEEEDIAGASIVIAATGLPEVNSGIGRLCRKKQILVNVIAPPGESSFIVPSVVDRGALLIAISTSGESPALSKRIRMELEKTFGPEYDLFLQRMSLLRSRLMGQIEDEAERGRVFQAVANSDVLDLLRQGKLHEADHRIVELSGLKKKQGK